MLKFGDYSSERKEIDPATENCKHDFHLLEDHGGAEMSNGAECIAWLRSIGKCFNQEEKKLGGFRGSDDLVNYDRFRISGLNSYFFPYL